MQVIIPKDRAEWLLLRAQDITSTESAALFGCSPYMTDFELWHRKKSSADVEINENERMKWGSRLQDSIASGIAIDQGWKIRPMREYIRDVEARLGASFDFSIDTDPPGILEVKNVDALAYRDNWLDDGENVEAPPHIECQVQHQLMVSGRKYAYIGALIGGNRLVLLRREPDENVMAAIRSRAAEFWRSIEENREPKPDFDRDAAFVSKLYAFADPGKTLNIVGDADFRGLAERHRDIGAEVKKLDEERAGIKARILTRIGSAEKVSGDGFAITAGMIGPARVEYDRAGYRGFKITFKKEGKK